MKPNLTMLFVLGGIACSSNEPPTRTEPSPTEQTTAPVGVAAEVAKPDPRPKPGDTMDVHGLTVKLLESGAIEVTGVDRWGAKLSTTFESMEYLRNALPTFERTVTAEQAAGLKTLAQ